MRIQVEDIKDIVHCTTIDCVQAHLKKGYIVWGKPEKMYTNKGCRHYMLYVMVLIEDKDHDYLEETINKSRMK